MTGGVIKQGYVNTEGWEENKQRKQGGQSGTWRFNYMTVSEWPEAAAFSLSGL